MSKLLTSTAIVFATVLAATPATAQMGPTTQSQVNNLTGGVRFRALATSPSQEEIYLGYQDLGVGPPNRVQANATYIQNGANSFTFNYDADADVLSTSLNGGAALNFGNFLANRPAGSQGKAITRLQFLIRDGANGAGAISLTDLSFNGNALSDLVGVENALSYWQLNTNLTQDFTLTGNLNLSGTFGASAEANRVEILVGNGIPEPATWAMMIGGFGLAGAAMRRREATRTVLA